VLGILAGCSSIGSSSDGSGDADSGLVLLPVQKGAHILNARTGAVVLQRPEFKEPEEWVGVYPTFAFTENGGINVIDATGRKTVKPEGVPSFPLKEGMAVTNRGASVDM